MTIYWGGVDCKYRIAAVHSTCNFTEGKVKIDEEGKCTRYKRKEPTTAEIKCVLKEYAKWLHQDYLYLNRKLINENSLYEDGYKEGFYDAERGLYHSLSKIGVVL